MLTVLLECTDPNYVLSVHFLQNFTDKTQLRSVVLKSIFFKKINTLMQASYPCISEFHIFQKGYGRWISNIVANWSGVTFIIIIIVATVSKCNTKHKSNKDFQWSITSQWMVNKGTEIQHSKKQNHWWSGIHEFILYVFHKSIIKELLSLQ